MMHTGCTVPHSRRFVHNCTRVFYAGTFFDCHKTQENICHILQRCGQNNKFRERVTSCVCRNITQLTWKSCYNQTFIL